LPRGLGDNPLTKQKRNSRGSSGKPAVTATSSSGSTVIVNAQDGPLDAGAPRYNDVFFQRRSDDDEARRSEAAPPQVSEAAPTAVPTIAETFVSAPSAPAPIALDDSPAPQMTEVEIATGTSPQEAAVAPSESTAENHNGGGGQAGGFFKRLFGRFQK
jgi:hypothetical protein